MKVLFISKTYMIHINQKKIEELSSYPDVEIMVITPQKQQETLHRALYAEIPNNQRFNFFACPTIVFKGKRTEYIFKSFDLLMRSFKPDIVHTEEGTRNLTVFQAALYRRIWFPKSKFVVLTFDNIGPSLFKPLRYLEKIILSQTDAVICGNEDGTKIIRQNGFSRPVYTIPQLGIDTDAFQWRDGSKLREQLKLDPDTFVAGFAGRLTEEKGPLTLLEAVARLKGKWGLVLIGSGTQRDEIIKRAMELGIINRVRIIDPVPHYELAKYYNMMDVLVSVSISLPRWKEQFGLVVAQAMSSGVPVIGSNSGETPNLIGKAGMIFPEGDSVALSNLLQRLQGDKALRSKLGQLGAQRIRDHYTNRKIADQTYKVWRNLYYGS